MLSKILQTQLTERISSSGELIWLKRAFFAVCRIEHTTDWKNMPGETKEAVKQSAHAAALPDRIAGEVRYA